MNRIARTKQADERRRLHLEGLQPPSTENFERQVERVSGHLEAKPTASRGRERNIVAMISQGFSN